MNRVRLAGLAGFSVLLAAGSALAAQATFTLHMDGAQETPGPGDPDGTAVGDITLNDVTGAISWDFDYFNIATPTLMHIHNGVFGVQGPVFIGLGVVTTGGPGTLTNSLVHGNLPQITSILTNPDGYYVNIHNAAFGPGAVRGQLPEPTTLALLGVGLAACLRRRRRAA
ncbi:MAG: CHRD domain-containing protein [Phycisphaerales bacterium]|nr:CHRD domain-containing protein [Phycisphaerales bacterium]